ncbi:MAG: RagB/SusD family nutrient uptake outer membrane protein [Bacteroidaceae bacterium]|nr:RagB/SusD family nutrient uptake outer membrane protein [Bacteroidaceae bacterium]
MKKIINILILAVSLVFTTSCDDFLDITPDGQVKRDELLNTKDGIEEAIYGVYAQLRSNNLYGQELSYSYLEIMAQTLDCYGNDAITALSNYDYEYSTVEYVFESVWTEMYKNISNVNSILNSPLIENATEYPYTVYRGEALGLRAFMHFDLMRIYAEQITVNPEADGIPYATEFSLNTPDFEKLAKNYEHIIADLKEAEELLADEDQYANTAVFMQDRQIHFNLYAVQATLARVYLTMGDKENAYIYAKKVIDNSGRTLNNKIDLVGDVAGVLSKKETIFGVYFAGFYNNVSTKLQQTSSYYSLDPRDDIMDIYNEEADGLDYRVNAYFTSVELGGSERIRLSKLTDIYELQGIASSRPTDLILGINMIRIPEMYYICAECLLDSDYDKALEYFDAVLVSRGLEPMANRIQGSTLTQELINLDRYKEFVGEGQTFFNMKRQNLPIKSVDGIKTYQPSTAIYVVPIPDSEYENRY